MLNKFCVLKNIIVNKNYKFIVLPLIYGFTKIAASLTFFEFFENNTYTQLAAYNCHVWPQSYYQVNYE